MSKLNKLEFATLIAECTAYDFKVMLEEGKPKSWLKSVSAFANGLGGSLFFGVDNDGNVKGVSGIQTVGEKISEGINDRMDPLPDVELIPHKVDGLGGICAEGEPECACHGRGNGAAGAEGLEPDV